MMKLRILFLLWLLPCVAFSQNLYRFWVELKDKDSAHSVSRPATFLSQRAIDRRARFNIPVTSVDLPVKAAYLKTLEDNGCRILGTSRWMNAVAVQAWNRNMDDSLRKLPFVKSAKYVGQFKFTQALRNKDREAIGDINEAISLLEMKFGDRAVRIDTGYYGKAERQVTMLNAHQLHREGFTGKGVQVALIDAGFNRANQLPYFKNVIDSGRVLGTYDFVEQGPEVFEDDDHGMAVWACMAALSPGKLVGTSPGASYWLLRSEYTATETLMEECWWVMAAEYADSAGADIINSSLGYNDFDETAFNHTLKDLDGRSTLISKAAAMAVSKGICVLSAAGNEGDNTWRHISVPSDVQEVITVGGTDEQALYTSFSSIGPTADKRVKPDVSALAENVWVPSAEGPVYQGNGTSYACPIVSGVVACLLQAVPTATPLALAQALRLSSSQYYAPDQFLGYGVPDAYLALKMLGGDNEEPRNRDALLDAAVLADKSVHLAANMRTAQKVELTVADMSGRTISKQKLQMKTTGLSRFKWMPAKKLKPGTYAVYMNARDGVSSAIFEIK